ncbi:MAG: cobalamin biosynthesis protein, partial [Lachnospiraceae bacterium]|nr:cobalamin biosynthesis protein [Lachnospiraceae bacterium]
MDGWIFAVPVLVGFCLDAVIGDPYTVPHPVRAIGKLITALERRLRKDAKAGEASLMKKSDGEEAENDIKEGRTEAKRNLPETQRRRGILLVFCVLFVSTVLP